METIIAPIDKQLIKAELTSERFMRKTRKGGNEIYIVDCCNAPNTLQEIGRLREEAFRAGGAGTGLAADIDIYDTLEVPCQQLLVWNPDEEEIIGGYRFILGEDMPYNEEGCPIIATAHLFHLSPLFMKEYLPYTLELGRSFVSVDYQSSKAGAKGIFALDNLWDGLGALTVDYPQLKYFLGKVTMYPSFDSEARDMILYFLNKHFPDKENLLSPRYPFQTDMDIDKMKELFPCDSFKEDYVILNYEVRSLGFNIPPLINAYMGLSPTMRMFGTAINDEFGDVIDSGILITVDDILEEKRIRHIDTYAYDKLYPSIENVIAKENK